MIIGQKVTLLNGSEGVVIALHQGTGCATIRSKCRLIGERIHMVNKYGKVYRDKTDDLDVFWKHDEFETIHRNVAPLASKRRKKND